MEGRFGILDTPVIFVDAKPRDVNMPVGVAITGSHHYQSLQRRQGFTESGHLKPAGVEDREWNSVLYYLVDIPRDRPPLAGGRHVAVEECVDQRALNGRSIVKLDEREAANVKLLFELYAHQNCTIDGVVERMKELAIGYRPERPDWPRSRSARRCAIAPTVGSRAGAARRENPQIARTDLRWRVDPLRSLRSPDHRRERDQTADRQRVRLLQMLALQHQGAPARPAE